MEFVLATVTAHGAAAAAAGAGCVHSLSFVDLLVCFEVTRLAESLPTLGAGVWPLPRVDLLMSLQVPKAAKALPTLRAAERPLTCVDLLVGF